MMRWMKLVLVGVTVPSAAWGVWTLSQALQRPETPRPLMEASVASPLDSVTIQPGDNLWVLARRHGTTVARLRRLNGMRPGDALLRVGRQLRIAGPEPILEVAALGQSPVSVPVSSPGLVSEVVSQVAPALVPAPGALSGPLPVSATLNPPSPAEVRIEAPLQTVVSESPRESVAAPVAAPVANPASDQVSPPVAAVEPEVPQVAPPQRRIREPRTPLPERFSLTIRSGSFRPRGEGLLFSAWSSALTLEPSDLRAQSIGVDGAWQLSERVELLVAVEGSSATASSQSRSPRPGSTLPVRQTTAFTVEPVGTVALRYYLVPPFRWIEGTGWVAEPSRVFLGGGLGMLAYQVRQQGEFVDDVNGRTFAADFASRGAGRTGYLSAGIEVPVVSRLGVLLEARYQWANAPLAGSLASFQQVDLSGLRLSVGVQRRW